MLTLITFSLAETFSFPVADLLYLGLTLLLLLASWGLIVVCDRLMEDDKMNAIHLIAGAITLALLIYLILALLKPEWFG